MGKIQHMRHCVPGQCVLFPLGPKCTIPFCRGELAPLRQSVHVGTPWSLARHTIYRTNMYRHISIVVRFQKHWIQCVHCTLIWNIERHKTPFASKAGLYGTKDPSSADFSNNFKWYMSLVRIYTVWNTIPPIDGIMTLQCHGVIVLWCHGVMVVEESTDGAIRFGMPRLLLMVSDLMVRTSLVTYSPPWYPPPPPHHHHCGIIILESLSWYHHWTMASDLIVRTSLVTSPTFLIIIAFIWTAVTRQEQPSLSQSSRWSLSSSFPGAERLVQPQPVPFATRKAGTCRADWSHHNTGNLQHFNEC